MVCHSNCKDIHQRLLSQNTNFLNLNDKESVIVCLVITACTLSKKGEIQTLSVLTRLSSWRLLGWLYAQIGLWKWRTTYYFLENSSYFVLKIELLLTALSNFEKKVALNPIQDGFFRGCSRMGGGQICHTYPTMMKLGTVILYLKKFQKLYKSSDTPFEFCWHQHFFYPKSANFAISKNTDIDSI